MGEALPAVRNLRGALATPQTIGVRQVMADGIIAVAAKAKDWPLLHEAVDIKIEDQREFVAEWDRRVRGTGNPNLPIVTERVTIGAAVLEAESGISKMQTSRWRKWTQDAAAYHDRLVLAACRKAGLEPDPNRVTPNSGENEWFTPAEYIAAAREVMGGIDLDPATHPMAQATVQATEFYTAQDDGLSLSWHGRVWLNPPYAQPWIARFVDKLMAELASGDVEQAIMLTNNCTDTTWFHLAEKPAALLCFTRGRINFYGPGGIGEAPLQGQTFFYYGNRENEFRGVFGQFGFVR